MWENLRIKLDFSIVFIFNKSDIAEINIIHFKLSITMDEEDIFQ